MAFPGKGKESRLGSLPGRRAGGGKKGGRGWKVRMASLCLFLALAILLRHIHDYRLAAGKESDQYQGGTQKDREATEGRKIGEKRQQEVSLKKGGEKKGQEGSPGRNGLKAGKKSSIGDGEKTKEWRQGSTIIGRIRIPGTGVDYPLVQAAADEPDYYLRHDIYGNRNPYGAIYLDAECADQGLDSRNLVILGHHIGGSRPALFGPIALYSDRSFAEEHSSVILEGASGKQYPYRVRFVTIIKGDQAHKRVHFANDQDFHSWYSQALEEATLVLDGRTKPERTLSLVTCSYHYWKGNERTVVVCSPVSSWP